MRRAFGWADYETGTTPFPSQRATAPQTSGTDPTGDLFAPVVPAARKTDPSTSNDGIADVLPRAGSQQMKLLMAYGSRPMGLTNEEAADLAGLLDTRSCWWKRCADLLAAGLIEDTFTERTASTGSSCRVCAITAKGKRAIK